MRPHVKMVALLTSFVVLAACPTESRARLEGEWGADGVQLVASAQTATIRYPCYEVTTDGPLVIDTEGRFNVPGKRVFVGGAGGAAEERRVTVRGERSSNPDRATFVVELSGAQLADPSAVSFTIHPGRGTVLPCPAQRS